MTDRSGPGLFIAIRSCVRGDKINPLFAFFRWVNVVFERKIKNYFRMQNRDLK